jgi:hypothetical protein
LAWLPGSDQPTKQAGTAQPKPHGTRPPYSPDGRACRARSGCGRLTGRRDSRRILHRCGLHRPVVSCAARVGLVCEADQTGRRWSARAVLAAGWHSTGLCGDLEQHVHDRQR